MLTKKTKIGSRKRGKITEKYYPRETKIGSRNKRVGHVGL